MKTLTIIVNTIDDDYDFNEELELIARQLHGGAVSGTGSNNEGSYSYEVNK